ncbi:hypothetical protein UlMin_012730 [Ulmus minor]
MQLGSKKLHLLLPYLLLSLSFCLTIYASEDALAGNKTCGKIPIQKPFWIQNYNPKPSPLNHMLFCKSQKLYFRTSLGLFPISSINYTTKTLTISDPSCSHSLHYVSPSHLSSGFPKSPHQQNSLLLFNCSKQKQHLSPFVRNYTCSKVCEVDKSSSCLVVDDFEKLDMGFHPRELNCSHYSRVYRRSMEEFELGTTISFDIPDHAPNICIECEKPNGNCGVGLRCLCHPKECKDKVVSRGRSINGVGNVLASLVSFLVVIVLGVEWLIMWGY